MLLQAKIKKICVYKYIYIYSNNKMVSLPQLDFCGNKKEKLHS